MSPLIPPSSAARGSSSTTPLDGLPNTDARLRSLCSRLSALAVHQHFGVIANDAFMLINSLAYDCACVIWLACAFQTQRAPAAAKFAPQGEAFKLHDWNRALGGLLRR